MLRASAMTTETDINLQGVKGDQEAATLGIKHGKELMLLGEAVATRNQALLGKTRQKLLDEAGASVLVDAAGVAANFQRMARIADSMGIPIDDMENDLGKSVRTELNLTRFASAANTLQQ